jgi:hypothetical protein
MMLGEGVRLFNGIVPIIEGLTAVETEPSPRATHLTYAICRG